MSTPLKLPGDWNRLSHRLTASHKALLASVADQWAKSVVATGPVDRRVAEAAVRSAYRAAGLQPPARVVWLDSPLAGAVAAAGLSGIHLGAMARGPVWNRVKGALQAQGQPVAPGKVGRPVGSWIEPLVWSQVRIDAQAQLGRRVWEDIWSRTGRRAWSQVPEGLWTRVAAGLREELDGPLGWGVAERVRQQAVGAERLELAWCATVDGLRRILPRVHGPERMDGLLEAVRVAGWWWPFERAVLLTERPVELHVDEQGRVHRPDGPAIAYPDGFALHAWHGLPVPASLIARLAHLGVEHIPAEPNVEFRRVMLEHYGFGRYLRDAGATLVHEDATGRLWRAEIREDEEPLVMVEVVNATAEPDGIHRVYWLRVPPSIRSARGAVAWTFGLNAEEYRPLEET